MLRRTNTTRTAIAVLAAGLGLSLVAAVAPANAAPASSDAGSTSAAATAPAELKASGPFAAAADGALVNLTIPSLSPSILPQTDVDLARTQANAESDKDVDTAKTGVQRSSARARTTGDTALLGAPINLQENFASAPPSEVGEKTLIPLDLSPLLNLPVIHTSALANWISDTECVAADKPLSEATQTAADLTLLDLGNNQSVAELNIDHDTGAVDTKAATFLSSIPGPNDPRAVEADVLSQVSSVNVFNNLAGDGSAIQARAVQTPQYVVKATGLPGGASVTGKDPVVEVDIAGQPLITLDSANQTKNATLTDLVLGDLLDISTPGLLTDLVNDLGLPLDQLTHPIDQALTTALNELSPVVQLSIPVTKHTAPDGTSASVQASLLRIQVLPPAALGASAPLRDALNQILGALGASITKPLLSLDVGPVGASVVAPAGGITCGQSTNPLRETIKHASATEVAPNGTFEYNIAVPNRGPCAVTDVQVTDVVTGPAGFTITGTEPKANTVDGGKVTWNLGTLQPNETRNLTITVHVPANAKDGQSFNDVVTASGKCDGRPVSQDDRIDKIPVVRTNFHGPCNVQFSNKDASHIQVTQGETFSYFVHAYNTGGEPCTNVKVTDTLDSRISFVSCDKSCTHSGQTVTWNVASIPGGSSLIFSVVAKVKDDATGTLANVAVIAPSNGSPVTVRTTGPVIGGSSIPKRPAAASRHPLPRTGGVVPMGLAAGLGAAALALFALRRRATAIG
jgi:uncharacterized repeat protein (TIGR01451 family)